MDRASRHHYSIIHSNVIYQTGSEGAGITVFACGNVAISQGSLQAGSRISSHFDVTQIENSVTTMPRETDPMPGVVCNRHLRGQIRFSATATALQCFHSQHDFWKCRP